MKIPNNTPPMKIKLPDLGPSKTPSPTANKTDASVIIKPQAYIKMLKHVLLYGNSNAAESVEVMGVCYGKIENGKLVQYDAVPVSHGGAIEVEFSPTDYAAFAIADEQFADKGYFAIGWYHSHPGLKAFFSKTDIKNHLFYQKDQTPNAYGIVFDHTYFDQGEDAPKYGFKTFRLNDYKKGLAADFVEIPVMLEMPEDLRFYREIDAIIESIQKKKPIILEAAEAAGMEGSGTWEETPEADATESEEKGAAKDAFKEIRQGYQDGVTAFNNNFMSPMFSDLQQFTNDTQNAALKGPSVIIGALEEMRDTIDSGLGRVQKFFESVLEKEIKEVNTSIEDQLKKFVMGQMEIPKKLQGLIQHMSDSLTATIGSQLETAMGGVIGNLNKLVTSAEQLATKQQELSKNINDQDAALKQFTDTIKSTGPQLVNTVGNIPKNVNASLSKKTDSMKLAVADLKSNQTLLKTEIDELSKLIMSKRK